MTNIFVQFATVLDNASYVDLFVWLFLLLPVIFGGAFVVFYFFYQIFSLIRNLI